MTFIAIVILHIFMCTVFVHSGKFLNGCIDLAMNTEVWCTSFSAFVILYSLIILATPMINRPLLHCRLLNTIQDPLTKEDKD